jgi:transglutaminase-like putative cysteine protease
MERLDEKFEYNPSATDVGTDLYEFSNHQSGVCQDFAHSMLAVCRQENLPARYVSGYIETGQGSDASHAWLEVYVPGSGWIGLDPTNKCFIDERHVVLAIGRDYSDCSPLKGIRRGGGEDTMRVSVTLNQLDPL